MSNDANTWPYFKFYAHDWLTSNTVRLMTLSQLGAYIGLLCSEWTEDDCTLPADETVLRALVRWVDERDGDFAPVLACFPLTRNQKRRYNSRLLKERQAAVAYRDKQSAGGKKGMEARWAEKPSRPPIEHACNGRNYLAESKEVLAFLNEKTGKHFREVDASLKMIEARLRSGVDVPTCRSLIARKARDWSVDPKMSTYLRPETLFNKTKFESYLAEVTK